MSLQPINQEQVQQTAQVLLAFLSDESVSVPGPMLDGVVSGKSLIRGLVSGQLIICQNVEGSPQGDKPPAAKKKVAKKKVAKKAA